SLVMLFIIGSFCTALSFILYNIALRHLEAAKASVIVLTEGVLSGIWAYLILAEKVNPGTIIGGALIIVATGIIIQESRAKSREAPYKEGVIE
ncbi:MAG TPA: EamA family transporter, partial [Methanomicrobia archaeon]|nr:EamA family transporter [Methanomicrobia archaeon]